MKRILINVLIPLLLLAPTLAFAESLPLCEFPAYNSRGDRPELYVYTDSRHWLDPEAEGSNPNGGIKFEMLFWDLGDGPLATDNVEKVVFRNRDTKNAYIAKTCDVYQYLGLTSGEYSVWLGDRLVLLGNWRATIVMNDGTRYRVDFTITEEMLQQPKPKSVEDIGFVFEDGVLKEVTCYAPAIENQEFRLRFLDDEGIVGQVRLLFPDSNELSFEIPIEYTEYTRARIETRDHGAVWLGYDSQTCEWQGFYSRSLLWIEIPQEP